jgi:hypothetical protein
MPPIAGKEGMVFCMNCSWSSVVNISSCQLAAGFPSSSAMSSSFFPSSGGIVAVFSCEMTTGSTDGFLCGIADSETDGFLVRIAAGFCSSWGSLSSMLNSLRAYSSISFQTSTSKDTSLLNDLVVSSLSLSLLPTLITIVLVIHPPM